MAEAVLLKEGGLDGGGPELDMAACLKAAAVMSPVVGGFTASTMPDLQSLPTDEKNLTRKPVSGGRIALWKRGFGLPQRLSVVNLLMRPTRQDKNSIQLARNFRQFVPSG